MLCEEAPTQLDDGGMGFSLRILSGEKYIVLGLEKRSCRMSGKVDEEGMVGRRFIVI